MATGGKLKGLLLLLILLLLGRTSLQNVTGKVPVDDFVEYWAAARLQLSSANPYAPDEILSVERSAGMQGNDPLVMLNPPWTIAFLLPFGLLDYGPGRIVWLTLGLALILLSVRGLWIIYGGPQRSIWMALALTFCFMPLLVSLVLGQITPFILAGIAGFLYFERRSLPLLAGVCLVPLTLKPHLFYLFWLALFRWMLQKRFWKICIGAVFGWLTAMALTAIFNPSVFAQYLELTRHQPPALHWRTPTFGTLLRCIFGMEHAWLQFLPMIAGTGWLLYQWRSQGSSWDSINQIPFLVIVSLTTTSYVWFYDQMLFLPAILQVAATELEHQRGNPRRRGLLVFAALNLILAVFIILKLPPLHYLWSFSAWLIWYCCFDKTRQPRDPQGALLETV
jgi:hypothetical protein